VVLFGEGEPLFFGFAAAALRRGSRAPASSVEADARSSAMAEKPEPAGPVRPATTPRSAGAAAASTAFGDRGPAVDEAALLFNCADKRSRVPRIGLPASSAPPPLSRELAEPHLRTRCGDTPFLPIL
jgi:hypothetical protein